MKPTNIAGKVYGLIVGAFLVFPISAAALMWFADGNARGRFDDAKIISVRYIMAVLIFMVLLVPFFVQAARRKPGAPLTWGEAMVAAVYTFFLLLWLFAVIPHEFLTWADAELAWRPDKYVIGPGSQWHWWSGFAKFPIAIHKQTFRDLIVVLLYVVGLGGFMWACGFWNKRGDKPAGSDVEVTSGYGRPLVAKARG